MLLRLTQQQQQLQQQHMQARSDSLNALVLNGRPGNLLSIPLAGPSERQSETPSSISKSHCSALRIAKSKVRTDEKRKSGRTSINNPNVNVTVPQAIA